MGSRKQLAGELSLSHEIASAPWLEISKLIGRRRRHEHRGQVRNRVRR
jgi:hypothetical protein